MKTDSRIAIVLLVAAAAMVYSCGSKTRTTPKGHKFTLVRKGDGKTAVAGSFLTLNVVLRDKNDSVWQDSRKQETPAVVFIREDSLKASEEGIDEVIRMLSKGDSISFPITAKLLFKDIWWQPLPHGVDSADVFTFEIGVKDVLDSVQMMALRKETTEKQEAQRVARRGEQLKKDIGTIEKALEAAHINAEKTASGLRYQVLKEGTGEPIRAGQTASVYYAGYTMEGKLFDTNIAAVAKAQSAYTTGTDYKLFLFTVGEGTVISGWEETILLMRKGEKIKVWIPSPLAYGESRRSDVIVENSILVFEIEVVDVAAPSRQAPAQAKPITPSGGH